MTCTSHLPSLAPHSVLTTRFLDLLRIRLQGPLVLLELLGEVVHLSLEILREENAKSMWVMAIGKF